MGAGVFGISQRSLGQSPTGVRRWRRCLRLWGCATVAVVACTCLGVSSAAVAQSVVSGATVSDAPLKIDPVAGGATSSTLQFDTASGPSVGFIQRMPVTKRVVRVAVGRFAASSSCTTPARVQLFVREHPTGDDAVSSQVAYSPAYASIDQTPQDVSLSIPATTFVKGRGYSFSVLWAGGPCRQVSQTVWDRAPGDGHVASGSGTCDLGPITSGSGGTGRRMWHEFGLSDRDSQCATTTLNGAAFGADMPTGWLVVVQRAMS